MNLKTAILLMLWLVPVFVLQAADMPGASDHPSIPRVTGSELVGYAQSEYDTGSFLVMGPDEKIGVAHPEGKRTRLLYLTKAGDSPLKIQKNYEVALAELGDTEEIFSCKQKSCSGHIISTTFWTRATMIPTRGIKHPFYLLGFAHNHTNPTYRYAKVVSDQAQYHIGVFAGEVADNNSNTELRGRTVALVEVVEVQDFEPTLEFIDASEMRSEMYAAGHVALYGIQFEHDKATLQRESVATINEITKVLQQNPAMKLYVVGHTDDVGALDYNQDLSLRRAQTVVDALVATGADGARLTPLGAGPVAPIGTNDTEAGRKLNRRVELVKRQN